MFLLCVVVIIEVPALGIKKVNAVLRVITVITSLFSIVCAVCAVRVTVSIACYPRYPRYPRYLRYLLDLELCNGDVNAHGYDVYDDDEKGDSVLVLRKLTETWKVQKR